jgi:hypothetical protein
MFGYDDPIPTVPIPRVPLLFSFPEPYTMDLSFADQTIVLCLILLVTAGNRKTTY